MFYKTWIIARTDTKSGISENRELLQGLKCIIKTTLAIVKNWKPTLIKPTHCIKSSPWSKFLSSFLKRSVLFPILSFSITDCNLTLWRHRDKSLHSHTQTLIHDLCDAPASVFTVNWGSPECTPQRTLQPLFSSALPGDSVRMKQRYEQLELPLRETYQLHRSQQHKDCQ